MQRMVIMLPVILLFVSGSLAQNGTAPSGQYPAGFVGNIWTGEVVATNDETREITLVYRKGEKEETFTGVLRDGYKVKVKGGKEHVLKPSGLSQGRRITVYYIPKTKKEGGKKINYSGIFKILFHLPEHES